MIEAINTETYASIANPVSQPGCEVSHFMKNFFEATQSGNAEETSTFYADDMEPFSFPLNAERTNENLLVDDHLATFSCSLLKGATTLRMTCVLDKSAGYWQIIHGDIRNGEHDH